MILKNLLRRKGRTLLTIAGVAIGVSAIIILGALAEGMSAGYDSLISNNQADLTLSQPNSLDLSLSAVDESVGERLAEMSEVAKVSGFMQGYVTADDLIYFIIFGYPPDSFILDRFDIVDGVSLDSREAEAVRGNPVILGATAAESLNKSVGDTVLFAGSAYTVIGIYESGSPLEDGAAVIRLEDSQRLLARQRQVNVFFFELKDLSLQDRVAARIERLYLELELNTTDEFAEGQIIGDAFSAYVWGIGGMAILIGGVGMANAQLMSVFERTREIGVLRAVGWPRKRVLRMILGESMIVSLLGGVLGIALGWMALIAMSRVLSTFGGTTDSITPGLIAQAVFVVAVLGFAGGWIPARRASQLEPVEALRYEGGAGDSVPKFKVGGMVAQSILRRPIRTLLTIGAISLTIGAIVALQAIIGGAKNELSNIAGGGGGEIMLRQANASDTSQSVIDVRVGERIEALPQVESVDGLTFAATALPETTFFILFGYDPNGRAIQQFKIIAGGPLQTNRQIIIGDAAARALNKGPGDSLDLAGSRFKIVGVYESSMGFANIGGVVTLRDGQSFLGRPRQATMMSVSLVDPSQAAEVVALINERFPEVHASLNGDFVESLPDFEATNAMMSAISVMAILVGGVGIMNTMLMAVMERTREIGALRALGWRRRGVLSLILREALLLGLIGGAVGVALAFGLTLLIALSPFAGEAVAPVWNVGIFVQALTVSLLLGAIGGVYPAFRATRMQPVEALRYE